MLTPELWKVKKGMEKREHKLKSFLPAAVKLASTKELMVLEMKQDGHSFYLCCVQGYKRGAFQELMGHEPGRCLFPMSLPFEGYCTSSLRHPCVILQQS